MHRLLILLAFFCAPPVYAQEAEETDNETTTAETSETDEEASEDEIDELDDDVELYPVEDEDAFIPSEDVAFGQSVPFPTDI